MGSSVKNLNNVIVLNRGDSFSFDLTLKDETSENGRYKLQGNDVVYFGLMDPHQPFETAWVRKRYTAEDCDEAGNLVIELSPKDTIALIPGVYYYSVKLKMDHFETDQETGEVSHVERVITVINKTKFFLND